MTFAAHPQETLHMSRTSPPDPNPSGRGTQSPQDEAPKPSGRGPQLAQDAVADSVKTTSPVSNSSIWTPSRTRSSQTSPASRKQFKEADAAPPERNQLPSPRRSRRNNKGRPPQRSTGHWIACRRSSWRGVMMCTAAYRRNRCYEPYSLG